MNKTIASISTPLGKGAISIVRMSGSKSLQIAKKVFCCKDFKNDSISPRKLYLGNFLLDGDVKEKCLAVYFKAPFSYTGEDMVEFQVHGGSALTQCVLNKLLSSGATMAQAGEFTKRAFENGKLSLDEAEAIVEEINAESESELKASLKVAEGTLKKKVKQLQNLLTEAIAQIEATLDYPEEDFEESTILQLKKILQTIKQDIEKLLKTSQNASYIEKGINVAIVGKTNVGKSSILNALVGQTAAIVTDIEGTTRDCIEQQTVYKGVKINFIDTAGIRNSTDEVEKIGIQRSRESIEKADVVLFVQDASRNFDAFDEEIAKLLKNKNYICIVNKIDKKRILPKQKGEILVSALDNTNIDEIRQQIYNKVIKEEITYSNLIVTNARQLQILKESKKIIADILNTNSSMDIIAMKIKKLWNTLGKITGECENESIIDMIFSKFCLGK